MKKIIISIVLLVISLTWGGTISYAAPACQDTSYIVIHVTLNPSDCENLGVCDFYVQIWLQSSPPRLLDQMQYVSGVDDYYLCALSPIYYQICPKLVIVGPCTSYTLTQTPTCTNWGSFPQWGNQSKTVYIDYCLD
jgi:hypothetical protein